MIRIGICDDSIEDRKRMCVMLERYFEDHYKEMELIEYGSGESFFENPDVDVLFLDIEMMDMNGIAVKNRLQKEQTLIKIIFITSYSQWMEAAFGKRVFGFLKKPVSYQKLLEKIELVLEDMDEEYPLMVGSSIAKYCISAGQVSYIKANGKYCDVKRVNGETCFSDRNISSWARELETKGFYQCHRSHLVNLYQVKRIEQDLVLLNGEKIPISRRTRKDLKDVYKEFIKKKAR
ncbi:MAG: response regulator transcription factor [Lachnospiraceae bacterium]|nr:response regulator transcription factor [Lachnospiraceae bacterium]